MADKLHGEKASLDVALKLLLDSTKDDLALPGLETIHHAWNRALDVGMRKQDQLLH